MTTISLDPNSDTGSITLDILKTSDVTKVVRTNINGTEEVRVGTGQLPSSATTGIVRTNLVTNPSFETGTTGYTNSATPLSSLTNPVSGGLFGVRRANITTTSSFPAQLTFGLHYPMTLTGGKTYVISYHGRSTNGAEFIHPYVEHSGGTYFGTALTRTVGDWTQKGVKFTVPGSGAQAVTLQLLAYYPILLADTTPVGTSADFDGVMVEEATALADYFDGATADFTGFNYSWTGTANASTSTLTTVGGRLILTDYEAAHGLNTFNVYSADGTFVTGSATLELTKPWLMVPIAPNYSEQAESITDYSANRETYSTTHRIIGRADPLVVMGKLSSRTGSFEIWTESLEDANRLIRVFDRGEAVLLKQTVPGLDMYLAVLSLDVSPYFVDGPSDTRYRLAVDYQEVTRPYGDLSGALGWTFDALAADYASFNAVAAAFATFDDLTIGDN